MAYKIHLCSLVNRELLDRWLDTAIVKLESTLEHLSINLGRVISLYCGNDYFLSVFVPQVVKLVGTGMMVNEG